MDETVDPYRVLQVDPEAEPDVVRAAYRALARKYHPDGPQGDGARMRAINEAWAALGDPERRAAVDRQRAEAKAAAASFTARYAPADQPSPTAPPPPPTAPAPAAQPARDADPIARRREERGSSGAATPIVLDFGRYQGWALGDVFRQDPDYLDWLVRTPIGQRFRPEVEKLRKAKGPATMPGVRATGRDRRR